MEMQDGLSLTLGATTVGLIVKEGLAWLRSRSQKTTIAPTPLPVEEADKFITRGECKRLMCSHDAQIAELRSDVKTGNVNILHKLEAMDKKSEERAIAAHSRIEPLVKELAKNIGQVELMKEAFMKATVGGKK